VETRVEWIITNESKEMWLTHKPGVQYICVYIYIYMYHTLIMLYLNTRRRVYLHVFPVYVSILSVTNLDIWNSKLNRCHCRLVTVEQLISCLALNMFNRTTRTEYMWGHPESEYSKFDCIFADYTITIEAVKTTFCYSVYISLSFSLKLIV
jgi:hypothetical protein